MKNFLDLLRKPKATSAELRDMIRSLSMADAEKRIADLEAARRKALLDGSDSDVEKLEVAITSANRDAERMSAAIEELTVRISEAEKRELNELLEDKFREAKAAQKRGANAVAKIDEIAFALAGELRELHDCNQLINAANGFVLENDRGDLTVPLPLSLLTELIGHRGWPQVEGFNLPGFFPQPDPVGRQLARIKEIKL